MKQGKFELGQPSAVAAARPADSVAAAGVTRPLRYAVRMVVFLAVVGVVAALLHEHAERFFMRNPMLNSLILSVLAVGIGLSIRAVLSLDPEVSWIRRFRPDDPGASIAAPPALLGPLAAMLRDSNGRFNLSATGMRSVLDGVDSRLDERRETSRYLVALLIFLGLLGTFWGLLLTATSVGETIRGLNVGNSDPTQMFETLRAGLEAPLSGMGTAFSTSLFGLASSLVLGFLDLQASQAQSRFATEVEIWLASLGRFDGVSVDGEGAVASSYLCALLEKTVESLDGLQRRMTRAAEESSGVHTALRTLGERWNTLSDELRSRNNIVDSSADAQFETVALLKRIAGALETQAGTIEDTVRTQLRSLDLAVGRLADETGRGRDRSVAEIRDEIRLLARTLSLIAERER